MISIQMAQKLLGTLSRGLLFILSAPAGTGKTTLVRELTKEFACVEQNVSWTTRALRAGEEAGVDYHFLSVAEFEAQVKAGQFLEHAKNFGAYYGSHKGTVEKKLEQGKHLFLVIDTEGARQVKAVMPAISIFVKPPSMAELRRRLEERRTETPEMIEARLARVQIELDAANEYNYQITNDRFEAAYQILRSICIAEEHRTRLRS